MRQTLRYGGRNQHGDARIRSMREATAMRNSYRRCTELATADRTSTIDGDTAMCIDTAMQPATGCFTADRYGDAISTTSAMLHDLISRYGAFVCYDGQILAYGDAPAMGRKLIPTIGIWRAQSATASNRA
jgi:hypothetical protein